MGLPMKIRNKHGVASQKIKKRQVFGFLSFEIWPIVMYPEVIEVVSIWICENLSISLYLYSLARLCDCNDRILSGLFVLLPIDSKSFSENHFFRSWSESTFRRCLPKQWFHAIWRWLISSRPLFCGFRYMLNCMTKVLESFTISPHIFRASHHLS